MLIETHLHTSPASDCAYCPPADMLRQAAARGVDAVCMTDHNNLDGFLSLRSGDVPEGLVVVPGLECSLHDMARGLVADVLFVADAPEVLEHLDRGIGPRGAESLEELLPPFPRDRFFVTWAHPPACVDFDGRLSPAARELLALVDAVEVRNGKRGAMDEHSPALFAEARRIGLRETGGSDAHETGRVAEALTEAEGSAATPAGVVALLRSARLRPVLREWPAVPLTPRVRSLLGRIRFE